MVFISVACNLAIQNGVMYKLHLMFDQVLNTFVPPALIYAIYINLQLLTKRDFFAYFSSAIINNLDEARIEFTAE